MDVRVLRRFLTGLVLVAVSAAPVLATDPPHRATFGRGATPDNPLRIREVSDEDWPASGDPVEILRAEIDERGPGTDDDQIVMLVSIIGGCGHHEFDLVWAGVFLESYPEQVDVHLVHDAGEDSCRSRILQLIYVDIGLGGPLGINLYPGPGYGAGRATRLEYGFDEAF